MIINKKTGGENRHSSIESLPTAVYGIVLPAASIAYYILQSVIITDREAAIGSDFKGKSFIAHLRRGD